MIFAQCSNITSTSPYRCLSVILRYGRPLMSFLYGGDCGANSSVLANRWTHVAFVHDVIKQNQLIYIDGVLDGFLNASGLYVGTSATSLVIGGSTRLNMYFNGLIDELSLITRVKSAAEIYEDATLAVYYTFDADRSLEDSGEPQRYDCRYRIFTLFCLGPNRINATMLNVEFVENGRLGSAASFSQSNSYLQASGLVLLGTSDRAYSISLWIYPYSTTSGTLLLASTVSWCLPLLGFTAASFLQVRHRASAVVVRSLNSAAPVSQNAWTHIAFTYASTTGVRLYINGTLSSTISVSNFTSSSTPMALTLGSCLTSCNVSSCSPGAIVMGQYRGLMDDFHLYSRQLSSTDIQTLANP